VRLLARAPAGGGYAPVKPEGRNRGPINAAGYRDLERAIPKPPAVRRAVCLGDSFTFGSGVLFDDTWPQRLERLLSRERGELWEAVNLGEEGLNTVQQAAKLAAEGFAYQPDIVVVAYVLNDSEDENAAEARRASDWIAARRDERAAPASPLDRSALLRLVRARWTATRENRRRIEGFRSMYADDYAGWIAARRALRTMAGLCRDRGVPLVIVVFPLFGNHLDDRYPFTALHARVAEAAGEVGARVVDLLPWYRGLDWRVLVVDGPRDEHPNEVAYRIASLAIAREVDALVPRVAGAPGER
jgi:hypothetical protein